MTHAFQLSLPFEDLAPTSCFESVEPTSNPRPDGVLQRKRSVNEAVARRRLETYVLESDPIYYEIERGEATFAEWESKVEEIRRRHPYPFPELVDGNF